MKEIIEKITDVFFSLKNPEMIAAFVLFVVFFTAVYYLMFKFLKENGATMLSAIIAVSVIVLGFIRIFTINYGISELFTLMPLFFVFVIALVYSVEIKRFLWSRVNKISDNKHNIKNLDEAEITQCIDEIIRAVQNMSKNDVGAIIVLANGNMPANILESGVKVEADITSQLIESVFFPKTPLHDGAMIINGTKILAAGCFLPLSQKENLPKELGTRHRAGIGITEMIDVTTILVSEETGIISIVKAGNITRYIDSEALRKTLHKFYWQDIAAK